eukprot:GFUD01002820.1.p1 GENE.GFUD01002820.1~~GFUD01002820.1.p1  ORF type:complete len:173 (+),score=13.58 GFUD01002820.1:265-783(+)
MEERYTEQTTMQEEHEEENDDFVDSCPPCFWSLLKYSLVLILFSFFLGVPFLMIYVGISYIHCEDMFAIWLLIGGVLCYIDLLILIVAKALKTPENQAIPYLAFFGILLIILIWWVFGFGRIFSGAMNREPVMDDPVCKWYLYTFPFWLCLSPFVIGIPILLICCCCLNRSK